MKPLAHRLVTRGVTLALVGLLALLATLQYQWTGQVSLAETERLRASLLASTRRLTEDFDEELGRMLRAFFVRPSGDESADLERGLGETWAEWRVDSPHPDLLKNLYVVEDSSRIRRWNPDGGLVEVGWSSRLEPARVAFTKAEAERDSEHSRQRGPRSFPSFLGEVPAILLPIVDYGRGRPRGFPSDPQRYLLLELDRDYIAGTLLPALADRYFGGDEALDYSFIVVTASNDVVYRFPAGIELAAFAEVDASVPLFTLRGLRGFGGPPPPPRGERGGDRARRPPGPGDSFRGRRGATRSLDEGHWRLLVRHRAGSLDAAVTNARRRNLAISFGILAVLAASLVMIVVSSRRATALSNQKMEFVAGVSHELRTPLAVIRSAGQNLADGSVSTPEQVRRYGELVEKEGRRLSALVDQVLEHAGIQSQRRAHAPRSLSVIEVVERALADYESLIEEKGIELETRFPETPVRVEADPDSLRRAFQNLIGNAIKHGGEGRWLSVTVTGPAADAFPEIRITVRDRGPGIPERERTRLFEAFYRGERAMRDQRPGSGLGLSLVRDIVARHGGRIEIESKEGQGTAFSILLPPEKGGSA